MPLEKVSLTRQQAFDMQTELLDGFSDPAFQRKLRERWKAAGDDMVQQAKARQEVCLEVQGPIIAKYGFEASRKGVAMSVQAFGAPEISGDREIGERNHELGLLADPSKRVESVKVVTRRSGREYMKGAAKVTKAREREGGEAAPPENGGGGGGRVNVAVGANCYEDIGVPEGCSVGQWRRLVAEGYFGKPVMYAERLTCHTEKLRKEVALKDDAALPKSPAKMNVKGPTSILNMLELQLKTKAQPRPRLGNYRMGKEIGSGIMGVCVYRAEHVKDGSEAAVKWPANPQEVKALVEIDQRAPIGCLGIPHLLARGSYKEKPYLVTELLGDRLSTAFPKPYMHSLAARWQAMRVIGRMLVRRLENLHRCGYVHCDVSPENVLLGPGGPPGEDGAEDPREALCLVDFGLARSYPAGEALAGDKGSAEWGSVRAAEGGVRRPEDDLEALGWMLLHGLFGSLPWIPILSAAYAEWAVDEVRWGAVRKAQRMKRQLLDYMATGTVTQPNNWELAGSDWQKFADVPQELCQFIRHSQVEVKPPARPNYAVLTALLGCDGQLTPMGAENRDRREWRELVAPLAPA